MKIYSAKKIRKEKHLIRLILFLLVSVMGLSLWPVAWNSSKYGISVKDQVYGALRNRGYDVMQDTTPVSALLHVPTVLLRHAETPPKVFIDIEFEEFSKIFKIRNKAMHIGMHVRENKDDWVKANLRWGSEDVKVKLRLKGDSMDHWSTDKWSFKINIKDEKYFLGMKEFSFQHPVTRAFQGEALVHHTMRHYGILAPRYEFVQLIVNGVDKGIMAVEESFNTELLEHNKRKDGVIFKIDETNAVIEKINPSASNNLKWFDSLHSSHIEPFNSSKVKKDQALTSQLEIAQGLMRGFMEGSLKASQVFDEEKTAKLLAILEIFGAAHTADWRNIRFYLNPYTLKIEPISYDSSITDPANIGAVARTELVKLILKDAVMKNKFERELVTTANDMMKTKWLDVIYENDQEMLEIFGNEFLFLREFPINSFKERIQDIVKNPKNSLMQSSQLSDDNFNYVLEKNSNIDDYLELFKEPLFVFHRYTENGVLFEIFNPLPNNVKILSIAPNYEDEQIIEAKNILTDEVLVPHHGKELNHDFLPIIFPMEKSTNVPSNWTLTASVEGGVRQYALKSHEYRESYSKHPLQPFSSDVITSAHPFFKFDKLTNTFTLLEGVWFINEPIIFPKAAKIIVQAGAKISFDKDAFFLCFGPVEIVGTKEKPVVFTSKNEQDYWQGLIVINAMERSTIANTTFENTRAVQHLGWSLTGAVTFYRSDVSISDSDFSKNIAEDSLNIVNSDFDISRSNFSDAISDFFDSDFSTGQIKEVLMSNSSGDGVDLSGSNVHLNGSNFINIRDKAISVGEGSEIFIKNVKASQVGTGVATKDGSSTKGEEILVENASFSAFAVYTKKPVYGPAYADLRDVVVDTVQNDHMVQNGNRLRLNGKEVSTKEVNVDELYQTVMKKNLN